VKAKAKHGGRGGGSGNCGEKSQRDLSKSFTPPIIRFVKWASLWGVLHRQVIEAIEGAKTAGIATPKISVEIEMGCGAVSHRCKIG
jgi:hypothetical protein